MNSAAWPDCTRRIQASRPELNDAKLRRDRARRFLAELMASDAADVLHLLQPVDLREVCGNAAPRIRTELILTRNPHHRVPVDGRVIVRGRRVIRRGHGCVIELLTGLGAQLGRVDEPVSAHPDLIIRDRQVRDDIAALIVGHDDARELRRQVGGFGDHPHAGFGLPVGRAHHAADVVVVDGGCCGGVLRLRRIERRGQRSTGQRPQCRSRPRSNAECLEVSCQTSSEPALIHAEAVDYALLAGLVLRCLQQGLAHGGRHFDFYETVG